MLRMMVWIEWVWVGFEWVYSECFDGDWSGFNWDFECGWVFEWDLSGWVLVGFVSFCVEKLLVI